MENYDRAWKYGLFSTKAVKILIRVPATLKISVYLLPVTVGEFRVAKKLYPSIDIGGVVEFYISRRWMARFDIGDTVIRYGEVAAQGFSLRNQIVVRPRETHHNLQITSGIGFRF